jgi:hypothetical protein
MLGQRSFQDAQSLRAHAVQRLQLGPRHPANYRSEV